MVRVLHLLEFGQFPGQLQYLLVRVEVPEFLEVNAFLGEDLSHSHKVLVRAPVLLHDFFQVF
jgi:hypothetical protein